MGSILLARLSVVIILKQVEGILFDIEDYRNINLHSPRLNNVMLEYFFSLCHLPDTVNGNRKVFLPPLNCRE